MCGYLPANAHETVRLLARKAGHSDATLPPSLSLAGLLGAHTAP